MSKKQLPMEQALPQIETQLGDDPEFAAARDDEDGNNPNRKDPAQEKSEAPAKHLVIPWRGQGEAHECPHCRARLLADRYTKACIVVSTRESARIMKCLHCQKNFRAE